MTLSARARAEPAAERLLPLKRKTRAESLLVHEVYASIQGESTWQGVPCVFVRTTGCHLRCAYCDTEHAFHQGVERDVDELVREVSAFRIPQVEITGGEPLLQPATHVLVTRLLDLGHTVLIETSGAVATDAVDARAHVILDVKTPGSGEVERNVWSNLQRLKPGHDELKLVITDDADYDWAVRLLSERPPPAGVTVLFSPAAPTMEPAHLAERIVADKLPVRFQLQLHKALWGQRRGV